MKYTNGNANIWLDLRDGTRIIEYPDNEQLTLETPLNIDIRVSTQCPYGYDTTKQKSTCAFCHESALVNGQECHYGVLQQVLIDANLPRGTEIALGVNEVTRDLIQFVKNLWKLGLVVNITMNERYILQYGDQGLKQMLPYVFGLGISYRSLQGCLSLPDWIAEYPHTVIHVINGIDDFGWGYDKLDTAQQKFEYLLATLGDTLDEVFKHPFYEQIKEWLFELGINISENSYESGYEQGYIDHQSYGMISESLFKTKEDLITYLFNDNLVIYIESDNDNYQEWYTGERNDD